MKIDGDVALDKETFRTPKYRLLFLICAAAAGLLTGVVQSERPLRPAASAPVGLYHALTWLASVVNQPASLAIIATAIIVVQARRGFQGWSGILGAWIASGMLGSIVGHYLSK